MSVAGLNEEMPSTGERWLQEPAFEHLVPEETQHTKRAVFHYGKGT